MDEFLPDQAPTADAAGRMVFHHAGTALEFGGRERRTLLGLRSGDTAAPRYVCVFVLAGREAGRVRYDDLDPWRPAWASGRCKPADPAGVAGCPPGRMSATLVGSAGLPRPLASESLLAAERAVVSGR